MYGGWQNAETQIAFHFLRATAQYAVYVANARFLTYAELYERLRSQLVNSAPVFVPGLGTLFEADIGNVDIKAITEEILYRSIS